MVRLSDRVIPTNHNVWVIHPGPRYRFLSDFLENSRVYLDLPGFQPPEDWEKADDVTIKAQLRRAVRFASYYRSPAPRGGEPSREIEDYRVKGNRPFRLYSTARRFFDEIPKGDLVLMPSHGYFDSIRFGEFSEPPNLTRTASIPGYGRGMSVQSRSVEWLAEVDRKVDLDPDLVYLLQHKPQALIVLPSNLKSGVYDVAYRNYVIADASTSSMYVGVDSASVLLDDIGDITMLCRYAIAAFLAAESGQAEQFGGLRYHDAILEFYDRTVLTDTDIEIHSPGRFLIRSSVERLAFVATAFLAIGLASCESGHTEKPDMVITESTVEHQRHYDEETQRTMRVIMDSLGENAWREYCDNIEACRSRSGLYTNADVEIGQVTE